jgi:hypothetical protein
MSATLDKLRSTVDEQQAPASAEVLFETREEWLVAAGYTLERKWLHPCDLKLPERVQYSVGWSPSKKALGFCVSPVASANGTTHVYVCPMLDSALEVLCVLCHELVHAVVGVDKKHGREFYQAGERLGLEGPAKFMLPGPTLITFLRSVIDTLGPWPHARVDIYKAKPAKPRAKNTFKFVSKTIAQYRVTVHRDLVDLYGAPKDPQGDEMEVLEE